MTEDMVNHPPHYMGRGMEAIDVIDAFDLDWASGSAVKYVLRSGKKGDAAEDIKKAIWCLQHRLKRLEPQKDAGEAARKAWKTRRKKAATGAAKAVRRRKTTSAEPTEAPSKTFADLIRSALQEKPKSTAILELEFRAAGVPEKPNRVSAACSALRKAGELDRDELGRWFLVAETRSLQRSTLGE